MPCVDSCTDFLPRFTRHSYQQEKALTILIENVIQQLPVTQILPCCFKLVYSQIDFSLSKLVNPYFPNFGTKITRSGKLVSLYSEQEMLEIWFSKLTFVWHICHKLNRYQYVFTRNKQNWLDYSTLFKKVLWYTRFSYNSLSRVWPIQNVAQPNCQSKQHAEIFARRSKTLDAFCHVKWCNTRRQSMKENNVQNL